MLNEELNTFSPTISVAYSRVCEADVVNSEPPAEPECGGSCQVLHDSHS